MARRQVIVQLDDTLVAALDALAAEEGVSRSELLRRGAAEILERARVLRFENEAIESYRRLPEDPVLGATFARIAAENALPYEEG